MRESDRLQFDIGDAGSDIQPGLALHADGLQRMSLRGDQDASAVFKTRRFPNPPSKYQMFDGEMI